MSDLASHPKNAGQPWLREDPRDRKKPYRGIISDAESYRHAEWPEDAYVYVGKFENHPAFAGERGHTSQVVWEQPHQPNRAFDIETLNSRYCIIPRDPQACPKQPETQATTEVSIG